MFTARFAKRFFPVTSILLCAVLATACSRDSQPATSKTPVISGPPNTAFPMPPLSGRSLTQMGWDAGEGQHSILADYKGQVLILDFYATWCVPCRETVPHLVELQRRHQARGLKVVGLNVGGPDDWGKVPDFARKFRIQYTLAVPDSDLSHFLLADDNGIPQTFVFDRHGLLIKRFIGAAPFQDLDQVVESALSDLSRVPIGK